MKAIEEEFGYNDTTERKDAVKGLYKGADNIYHEETHATVQDVDYAVASEGYDYLDKIDRMLDRFSSRINDLLHELAWCDAILAKRARTISDRIIEGALEVAELKPTEAPLLSAGRYNQTLPPA